MTPQGPSTRRLRSLVMGVSLFHGMQKENTRRQQFDKVVDLPKGKLLSFQLKKISIIHEHFHLFHMYEYNNSSLIFKIYFSKEYGRIVIFIYNFKKNNCFNIHTKV